MQVGGACMEAHHGGDRMFVTVAEHVVLDIDSRGEVIKLGWVRRLTLHYWSRPYNHMVNVTIAISYPVDEPFGRPFH